MHFHCHGDGKRPVMTMQWIAAVSNSKRVKQDNTTSLSTRLSSNYLSNCNGSRIEHLHNKNLPHFDGNKNTTGSRAEYHNQNKSTTRGTLPGTGTLLLVKGSSSTIRLLVALNMMHESDLSIVMGVKRNLL